MTTQPNATEIQRFFAQLYPDVEDGWLVLSRPDPDPTHANPTGKRWLRSEWLDVTQTSLTRVAEIAARLSAQDTVYFGVALQRPDCVPDAYHRSTNAGAYVVPGLWFDLDLAYGQHAASALPTTDTEALDFLTSLPAQPSLIVHSGGGLYPLWLFKEPYLITTPAAHAVIKRLAEQFTHTVVMAGKQRGWTLDALGDLARVLRPPGSINFKYGKLVEVIHESGVRYNPSDFDWLVDLPTCASTTQAGAAIAGQPDLATIAAHYGTRLERKSRTELAGAHPQHGSSTGDNFNVNLDKGVWHCWRHGTGGDALALIAVCEDLVPCEDMHAGVLCGDRFQRAVAVANHTFQAGITLRGPHCGSNGHVVNSQAATPQTAQPVLNPVEAARQAAEVLRQTLPTLAADAKEDAVLDALHDLASLDMISWMRLKRQLKTAVPTLNQHDLERARQELRRTTAPQATTASGRSQAQIAVALARDYAGQFAYDLGRQAWMAYGDGLWKPLDTERVTQQIMACMDTVLQGDYTWHACAGVEHLLRARLAQTVPLETPGWLPFQNGALCLETMTLHPHRPERPFTWQLPHAYDPQATCPQTQAWLHETVGGAHDQVQVLRAYAKAVVTRRVDLQRYLETLGPGGTGKGTYTRLLMALVGCENTVATELKHLEANRFELSQLRGKVLMVITDAERYSGPVNALKAITGQDFVRMEEKFKAQRTEVAPVMVVVAANEPVQSADYTSGLVRRRLSMAFRQRPAVPRDLLSWHAGAWHGELAPEIPGVLNWVLTLPDAQMEALLQQTTTLVPSLQATWAQSLVDTTNLAMASGLFRAFGEAEIWVTSGIYLCAELFSPILPTYSQNSHRRPGWHGPHVACRVPLPQEEAAFILPPILAFLAHFVPDRMTLALQGWHLDETAAQLTLQVTATRARVRCPLCHAPTPRVHSWYRRTLADLPWGPYTVRLHLRVRKFFCDQPTCPRQIFTERLPTVATPWARRTLRLAQRLRACGVALGGEMGARLGSRLGLGTSPDTLLRLVQGAPAPAVVPPQVLGVDEWAWRRGQRYGTILVNLENHQVLDLLPERSADLVAHWLTQHPTVTVVCRDRSALYADGIRRGAPHAVQVVDRFHLVKNLREAIEALLHDQRPALQAAAAGTAQALTQVAGPVVAPPMYRGRRRCVQVGQHRQEAAQQQRHAAWVTTYEAIHTLRAQGTSVTTIAAQLGISRPTVYAYLRRTRPPSPRSPQRSGQVVRPYMAYLIQRWREGCTDSMQLWRETRALGYAHSARTVSRFITRLRRASAAGWAPETQTSSYTRPQGPSARAVSFTWVCPAAKRGQDAQLYVDQLCQMDPSIEQAYTLSQAFLALVRERRGDALDAWMTEAVASGLEALARFAQGLHEDLAAVKAGLTLPWSNGPVEGHINRLKLLKRQGYGRADVGLLRQHVIQVA